MAALGRLFFCMAADINAAHQQQKRLHQYHTIDI
jgi:hypothetical protein